MPIPKPDPSVEEILEAIRAFDGVPSIIDIAHSMKVADVRIKRRMAESPRIQEAIDEKGLALLKGMSDAELLVKMADFGWSSGLTKGRVRKAAFDRFEAILSRTLESYGDFPTPTAISRIVERAVATVISAIERNPELGEMLERKQLDYIHSLSDQQILAKASEEVMASYIKGNAKKLFEDRFNEIVLRAIRGYDGVPTDTTIATSLGLGVGPITRKKDQFNAAMEARGREYLSSLSDADIAQKYSEGFTTHIPDYAKQVIYKRIQEMVERAIRECTGVPHPQSIGEAAGIRSQRIPEILDKKPALKLAMERRGRENIEKFSREEILEMSSRKGWFAGLPDYAQNAIWARLDDIIIEAIRNYEGVPTGRSIGRAIDKSAAAVQFRFEHNPALVDELEKRGREYLAGLTDAELVAKVVTKGLGKFPDYAKKIIYGRFDGVILRSIENYDGTINIGILTRLVKSGYHTIQNRIEENPELWTAYYAKRGLTADQAIELALERDEESNSVNRVLSDRLRNLYAFREMAGIIRCFGHLLKGKTLEVSLYPEPMKKAAEELGVSMDVLHQDMKAFRRGEAPPLEATQAAILQGIHRLDSKGLTRLFASLRSVLGEGAQVIATYSVHYKPNEDFISALQQNGFEVRDSGILLIEPPSKEALLACGAPEADVSRIARKMEGESRLLFITAVQKTAGTEIPKLEKLPESENAVKIIPNGETIDIPKGAVREINARFLFEEMAILPSAPFMIDARDGDRKAAVLGFDMDPARPRKVEFGVYPGAPQEDFRRIARQLATKIEARNALGIKPGQETRVQMSQLRKLRI